MIVVCDLSYLASAANASQFIGKDVREVK